ncbi:MAG: porin, partial [Betaproteobacteria bacterium]|nr:porin [Betaproteobacteria bacterium]
AGINEGDRLAADGNGVAVRSNGSRVAVAQQMGPFYVGVMSTQQTAKPSAGEVKSKVTGIRADYALSKRTTAYLGYEKWDTGTAAATNSTTGGTRTISSVGLRHSW